MSRWFRHYAGMMRDDKLVRVAIRSGQTIERVVWIYGAILESAAELDDAGNYEVDAPEIAYFLRASEADVLAVLAGLEAIGRIRDSVVVKWGDRQFSSDRSAERQKRYRDKKREDASGGRNDDVGNPAKPSHANAVTSPSRHGDAPETELETETEEEGSNEPSSAREIWAAPPVPVSKQVWSDFKANRRRKKLGFTLSTYAHVRKELERVSSLTGIPPPTLLEHAAAEGWGGIYDPNERKRNHGQSASNVTSLQRPRPNLTALLRASSGDPESGFGTRPALPASGNG